MMIDTLMIANNLTRYNMQIASQDKTFLDRLAKIRKYAAML